MKKTLLFLVFTALTYAPASAQVGIGNTSPDTKSALDITASGKGLLIPRMDSVTRVGIASPLPDGLMVFQTDGRKGFWYAVSDTWLYIPDKAQANDNLGNHTATDTFYLNGQRLFGNTTVPFGDSAAQVELVASAANKSAAVMTRSNNFSIRYTRTLLSGYGRGPFGQDIDFGVWSHAYRGGGWAFVASSGFNGPTQPDRWVGLAEGPGFVNAGSAIRIVDGTQGAGKVLTSDAVGYGTWQTPSTLGGITAGSNGRVGIGAPGPSYTLDLSSADPIAASFSSTGADPNGVIRVNVPATNSACNGCSEYITFVKGGTTSIGSITANLSGNSVLYNTTSDKRLKEAIAPTRFGLADLMKVEVKDYNFIGSPQRVTGFLAQDLHAIYPDAVKEGDHGEKVKTAWAVDYGKLTPLLVKAVQDQQAEIEDLKSRIASLEALLPKTPSANAPTASK